MPVINKVLSMNKGKKYIHPPPPRYVSACSCDHKTPYMYKHVKLVYRVVLKNI